MPYYHGVAYRHVDALPTYFTQKFGDEVLAVGSNLVRGERVMEWRTGAVYRRVGASEQPSMSGTTI